LAGSVERSPTGSGCVGISTRSPTPAVGRLLQPIEWHPLCLFCLVEPDHLLDANPLEKIAPVCSSSLVEGEADHLLDANLLEKIAAAKETDECCQVMDIVLNLLNKQLQSFN
jgi:hypothetical protein